VDKSDDWHRLLSARRERPTSDPTADERDELPSPHGLALRSRATPWRR
jgi:hypothetical protein